MSEPTVRERNAVFIGMCAASAGVASAVHVFLPDVVKLVFQAVVLAVFLWSVAVFKAEVRKSSCRCNRE